jgi:hypothetical protein
MVEQLTLNQRVAGSSPARFTTSHQLSSFSMNTSTTLILFRFSQFRHVWEQNLRHSLDRTPLRVRDRMHVGIQCCFYVRVAQYCLSRFHGFSDLT